MNDPNCLFCKIINKQIPAKIEEEGEDFLAIADISPQAPTHILVMPKIHVADITECDDAQMLGKLFQSAVSIAKAKKLNSFRLAINTGVQSGQSVFHLHIHILGGRPMQWPPG